MVFLMGSILIGDILCVAANIHDEAELARKVIQAERRLAIFRVMDLTDTEKTGFWPIYDEYITKIEKLNDRTLDLIRKFTAIYETISDKQALEMLTEMLAIENDRIVIKMEFVKKFQPVLPGVKVARFFQAENKLDAQRDLNLAAQIPLAGRGKGPQASGMTVEE
jgi:hypothetical protein